MLLKFKDGLTINLIPGFGFTGILTIIFVLAKIFNKITWSWWWVFSPIWLPIATIIGIFMVIFGGGLLLILGAGLLEYCFKKKPRFKSTRSF